MKKISLSLVALVASGLLLTACIPQPTPEPTPTVTPAVEAPSDSGAAGGTRLEGSGEDMGPAGEAIGVKTVEIEAGSFYYKPNTITVKKGEKVKIVMNSVSMMHDFVIDDLNVKMPVVQNGNTGTVEFTADKVGTFEYYCSVGQHKAQGQVGTLVVTE
jgi:nitrosocyanin